MSFEELKEHEIFLPESEWGQLDLATSVNLPALIAFFALGAASCVLMIAGGGRLLTWVGAGLFIAFMYGFALVSNAGIERQSRRIEALHASHAEDGPGRAAPPAAT